MLKVNHWVMLLGSELWTPEPKLPYHVAQNRFRTAPFPEIVPMSTPFLTLDHIWLR